MKWDKSLSVGVQEIDKQHQKLIEIINRAYDTDLKRNKEVGEEILSDLIEFTRVHFTTEENYFKKCNYGGASEHIAEHMKYIEKILKFQDNFANGKCDCVELMEFLKAWLVNHLKVMDFKYIETFKRCGLK